MKSLLEIFTSDWTNALGWTLLHSLWQSLAILLITFTCLRLIPAMRSRLRYLVACCGFLLMIAVSVATFIFVQHQTDGSAMSASAAQVIKGSADARGMNLITSNSMSSRIVPVIEAFMPYVVALWAMGFLFYSARLYAGLIQTQKLRRSAILLENEWGNYLVDAGKKLGIERLITLAESYHISTPMVIGYFKPAVLIPAGMLSGLSTEQLETIFLHELAHIRRNDYLINLIQSLFEAILFFNPFVRILSNEIRREREYCCDDLVVRHHGSSRAYAYALTRLAEAKLSSSGFALALANDNNQLLHRIKRIMDKSARHTGKSRIAVPAILLLGALLCTSWLGSGRTDVRESLRAGTIDDTLPKNKNAARYSRKSIITFDENGQPHEEIVEEFEGDERLRPLIEPPAPASPHFDVTPPNMAMPRPHMAPAFPDTIPPAPFGPNNHEKWEEWSRSLEERLQERFEDLYGDLESDTSLFRFELDQIPFPDWDNFKLPDHALKALEEFEQAETFQDLNEQLEKLDDLELEEFRQFEKDFGFYGGRMGRYEKVLRDELVKDGYLKEGEAIESLEWNDDSFKVNGKAIKESHRKKYNNLNTEFFGEPGTTGRVE